MTVEQRLVAYRTHLHRMQAKAVLYLQPEGKSAEWFIGEMIELLDGPEQRALEDG